MIPVYCEICESQFAQAEPQALKEPMKGAMFISHLARNGAPNPFHPDVDWQFMKCPYCGHRPFLNKDRVLISPPIRKYYVFGDTIDKSDSEKTPYERNQEAINAMVFDEDVETQVVSRKRKRKNGKAVAN